MNRHVLADTGPLYALTDPSDQYYIRAHDELNRIQSSGRIVAITFPTVAETHTLVLRWLGVPYAHQWLEELRDGALLINPEPGDFTLAFAFMRVFHDQSISVVDAVT